MLLCMHNNVYDYKLATLHVLEVVYVTVVFTCLYGGRTTLPLILVRTVVGLYCNTVFFLLPQVPSPGETGELLVWLTCRSSILTPPTESRH